MLCVTYENNSALAGKSSETTAALSIIAHMTANAQIEITLTQNGDFYGAVGVDKENGITLIPITEKSASRTVGIEPHPLCDTLSYVAGDFSDYLSTDKEKKKAQDKFTAYSDALGKWVNSEYTHPKIKAIYYYISQKQMLSDLVKSGIVELKDDGTLSDKKIKGNTADKAFVRFRVLSEDVSISTATWEDNTLFDVFTRYYLSAQDGRKDICYINGDTQTACTIHPKGIIAANYGAKLVSSNDLSGFTFRGRFNTADEAYSVGYAATQKAHAALTWLAKIQGVTVGNQDKRTYVCWNPRGKPVPFADELFGYDDDEDAGITRPLTEPEYADRLEKALKGYNNTLDDNDDIVIIALDAATTGRLSVTYYNELKASCFLNRFKDWSATCRWYYPALTQDRKLYYEIKSPLARRTVEYAFGAQQSNFVEVSDKIMKEQYQRIVHCMFDAQPVPRDIVHALVQKASNPQAYSFFNYENILSTACAYIVKYYLSKGVKYEMTLDCNNKDRSYLFGRLLAVAEKIERSTYDSEEKREPNAIRLQPAFVHHPMSTWMSIDAALKPYFERLLPGSREYYRGLISEIIGKISESDAEKLNKSLEYNYLIGYYLQRAELKKSNKEKTQNNKQEEE